MGTLRVAAVTLMAFAAIAGSAQAASHHGHNGPKTKKVDLSIGWGLDSTYSNHFEGGPALCDVTNDEQGEYHATVSAKLRHLRLEDGGHATETTPDIERGQWGDGGTVYDYNVNEDCSGQNATLACAGMVGSPSGNTEIDALVEKGKVLIAIGVVPPAEEGAESCQQGEGYYLGMGQALDPYMNVTATFPLAALTDHKSHRAPAVPVDLADDASVAEHDQEVADCFEAGQAFDGESCTGQQTVSVGAIAVRAVKQGH